MYCVKCRRVTETEYITISTFKNGRLMRRGQCITCAKTMTQFIKSDAIGGSLLILWLTISLSKCIYQDITLLAREQNSTNAESGWNAKGVEYTNK